MLLGVDINLDTHVTLAQVEYTEKGVYLMLVPVLIGPVCGSFHL